MNPKTPKPSLFGLQYSNRDFTRKEAWGKNCFNSSFPASLCAYLHSHNLENIYLKLNSSLAVEHSTINTDQLYALDPLSDNIFYAFETQFTPYQQYVLGTLPGVDLVTQARDTGNCLQALEIKLTALPDNSTCDLNEDEYGCELVIRPDTIVYLACSFAQILKNKHWLASELVNDRFSAISDWSEPETIIPYLPDIINSIDQIVSLIIEDQTPFLMQPIWKTQGKSPQLSEHCMDIFIWSNLAFSRLFIDAVKTEIKNFDRVRSITRQARTVIWLFKMIDEFANKGIFDYRKIIDFLSYNTKNDKTFAVSGRFTHVYMKSEALTKPRIQKQEISNIILGGGQNLLSPERRLDAIIYNSPDLFIEL
ncbi:HindVP family restriction endonuclease [Roseofilum capinflatum]|uniref:HindVP family restriction endonuclease n=1 Tax=Roseofilum capinflatum BLCC-M114 TaxID=3022440 RepID=A0ABT7B5I8_9CYAN|nr:HindVP family restriction endonuclease [Roseofilum capinflatum]MDJ1174430.1 HindVP family restriction endonuclease [Roseofilum capinflatum BLCC-M114]